VGLKCKPLFQLVFLYVPQDIKSTKGPF